jgi:hypothetical protein
LAIPKKIRAYDQEPTSIKKRDPTKRAPIIVNILSALLVDLLISVYAPITGPESSIKVLQITNVQFKYIDAATLGIVDAQNSR